MGVIAPQRRKLVMKTAIKCFVVDRSIDYYSEVADSKYTTILPIRGSRDVYTELKKNP